MIVAATGGVAAIKTPSLLRRLREAGYQVRAAATADAYRFVTPLSLAVAAGGPVFDRESWFAPDGHARHIELARWADALVVAPATADALADAAHGKAGDVVSALVLAGVPRVVWLPAMNGAMWRHPAVAANVATLRGFGHRFFGPDSGPLAAAGEGSDIGRMAEPEALVEALPALLGEQDLRGRKVLVSAGPTREYLDPVRFLSNPSSGKMGFALAAAAQARGADVVLVSGPTTLAPPPGVTLERVESAEEMLAALSRHFDDADLLLMSAAVADWRPAAVAAEKEAKMGEHKTLELVRTPDILTTLAQRRGKQVIIGFAMETDQGVERATEKARRKGLDLICLNYPTREGSAFGGDENEVTLVTPEGQAERLPRMRKRVLADRILDRARTLLEQRSA